MSLGAKVFFLLFFVSIAFLYLGWSESKKKKLIKPITSRFFIVSYFGQEVSSSTSGWLYIKTSGKFVTRGYIVKHLNEKGVSSVILYGITEIDEEDYITLSEDESNSKSLSN